MKLVKVGVNQATPLHSLPASNNNLGGGGAKEVQQWNSKTNETPLKRERDNPYNMCPPKSGHKGKCNTLISIERGIMQSSIREEE